MAKNKKNENPGVSCVVDSCVHYMNGDKCDAEKIHVEPKNAAENKQTDCATFKCCK